MPEHGRPGVRTPDRPPAHERRAPEHPATALQRRLGNHALAALAGRPVVQRDLAGDVRGAITARTVGQVVGASDAVAALRMLSAAEDAVLTATMLALGQALTGTLLDLLPESAQRGPGYTKVLLAMPEAWLDARLAAWPRGEGLSGRQRAVLRELFQATPDARLPLLKTITSIRFSLAIGGATTAAAAGETAIDWEPGGLRRMYPVLEALPAAHVAANAHLISMGRYQGSGVSGYYWRDESAIGYDVPGLANTQSSPGDPLHGVNRFDKVVRHEVGHAVDRQMGWAAAESSKPERGGWTAYDARYRDVVDAMYAAYGDNGINKVTGASRRSDLKAQLRWVMANRAPDQWAARVQALPWFAAGVSQRTLARINEDQVVQAVLTGLRRPWYNHPSGGVPVGGKIYQESYANEWVAYDSAARARKVSQYQFRAPGEWFAEAYAAYYEPGGARGARLAQTDRPSKLWFDEHVHTLAGSR